MQERKKLASLTLDELADEAARATLTHEMENLQNDICLRGFSRISWPSVIDGAARRIAPPRIERRPLSALLPRSRWQRLRRCRR
jgi:hypothetical protein